MPGLGQQWSSYLCVISVLSQFPAPESRQVKKGPLSCAKLKFKAMPCAAMWWKEMKDGTGVLEGKLRQILLS